MHGAQQQQQHSQGQAYARASQTASSSALHGANSAHASPSSTIATPTNSSFHQTSQPQHSFTRNQGSSASPAPSGIVGAGAKRRADASAEDNAQKQQRSKRNRYISIACNECKRRKIKCNGETPCFRCGNLNLQCLYAPNCCSSNFRDSDEFKQMNESLSILQEQMETLQQKMSALQQETLRLAPLNDRVLPLPAATAHSGPSPTTSTSSLPRPDMQNFRSPTQFRGPTSASSHVNVARNTLQIMLKNQPGGNDDNGIIADDMGVQSPPASASFLEPLRRPIDPLWDFDTEEMIRLCRVHEEEVGIMYPVVSIEDVIAHAKFLANFRDAARRSGLATPHFGAQGEGFNNIKTLELKIIMCCALVVEEHGNSPKANRLWESIQPIADKMLMSDPSDVTNLPFLALVGGFRFLANEEVLAWRVMGQVARLCLEMGLHRRDGIARIEGEQDRRNAVNTFWSAYVLDRRWSFGTGFPFVVHDDKIDPGLPYPEDYPYLTSMIEFSKISSNVWRLVDYFDSVLIRDLKREDFEMLDHEILEWYGTVPDSIRISNLGNHIPVPGTSTYNIERLQIWTRLRLNQIRIWLYTPVLHTFSSIKQNEDYARLVVGLAKETIQYLTLLNNSSVIYRRIQVFYHHFLTSAIAVLFLASAHAPAIFSSNCRDEFHMALELVKDLSAKSWVSQRLWRTVKNLKSYEGRLGLQQGEDSRKRDNAALTIPGMAGSRPNQHGSHRNSVSSGGHQPSPSPGLTPSHGGHQRQPSSRMGSVTPHGGRASPRSGSGILGRRQRSSRSDDLNNGLRLQTEMTRIFEEIANGAHREQFQSGNDGFFTGPPNDYPGSGGDFGTPAEDEQLYPRFRDMF